MRFILGLLIALGYYPLFPLSRLKTRFNSLPEQTISYVLNAYVLIVCPDELEAQGFYPLGVIRHYFY